MDTDTRRKLRELAMAVLDEAPWPDVKAIGDYQSAAHPGVMIELLGEREGIAAYLRSAIAMFDADPADSDHQEGYLEALQETLRVVTSGAPFPAPKSRPKLTVVK